MPIVRVPVTVTFLGRFAGGSFGVQGNPSNVYQYWAVRCALNCGDTCKQGFAFTSEAEANTKAEQIRKAEEKANSEHAERIRKDSKSVEAFREALRLANIERDEVIGADFTEGDGPHGGYWKIKLVSGREYRLTNDGRRSAAH